ncbi:hypothetical protein SLW73_08165 [Glutamicibacter protophormiae]|uniref:hypothetical protein n=1 Tax=Glutamicibacter protophormiae TaxID=37930 RepID=UPI002A82423F|nr:hypothetical protein [Glutamicibacter protophormiae]WPR66270.1 hypothetical protein SLW72_08170 [Glutamicibacter protophormiae]WPR69767.1 hypothetical protein SLW73_08165 [Glutamicibacter protophormiae]
MTLPAESIRKFYLRDSPDGSMSSRRLVIDAINRSSFTVEYIYETNPHARPDELRKGENFGTILKPGEAARRLFGFDREILLWCSTFRNFQARDTAAMADFRSKNRDRLSSLASVLVTQYDKSARNITEDKPDHSIVHFSLADMKNEGLHNMLARNLYTRDLFDVSGATVASADFFGRREVVDRIVGEVSTGTSQIGIFGLRKVGKTSLLNRINSKLQNSNKIITARLDLQWTVSINESPEYTVWALGESLFAAHRSIRHISGFRLFGKYSTFSLIKDSNEIWELFVHDYKILIASINKKICLLVDEIERMYESSVTRGFVRFWRLLRGLDQQVPGRLRIVIGGTSPECAQAGKIGQDDNPLFNYLKLEYLGPLDSRDACQMLVDNGKLMGLDFHQSGLAWALEQCGGAPGTSAHLGIYGSPVAFNKR